jgi:hypothetical protein
VPTTFTATGNQINVLLLGSASADPDLQRRLSGIGISVEQTFEKRYKHSNNEENDCHYTSVVLQMSIGYVGKEVNHQKTWIDLIVIS